MDTGLNPYPEYKQTDEPWLPSAPRHWALAKLKHVLTERNDRGFPQEPLLAATQTKGVVLKSAYENRTVVAQKDLHLLKLVRKGDFVISLRSFQGGVEFARDQGIISPAYTVLSPRDAGNHGYLAALFKSRPFIGNLTLHVTGIRQGQNVDYVRLSRSRIPMPAPDEQAAIVAYLAALDRRVGRFVRAKRRLIELLTEQKQAIITHAVTRGLDPAAPMKPSGIDWLGEVPGHWRIGRVKSEMINLNTRRVPLSSPERGRMVSRGYDYYGASGVIDKVDNYLFDDELLLIAEDGANLVLRNLPLAIIARGKFWVNNHAHILKARRGNIEYFAAVLESIDYLPWITGAAQPKLTKDRLMGVPIPVPPPQEQDVIVQELKTATAPLEEMLRRAQREIDLICEYRTRLVADAVTGKVDVRAAVAAPAAIPVSRSTAAVHPTLAVAVLDAAIIARFNADGRLHRIRRHKITCLTYHHAQLRPIQPRFVRDVAGPRDLDLIDAANEEAERRGWFRETERQGGYRYDSLPHLGTHKDLLGQLWADRLDRIEAVFTFMARLDRQECENAATVYMAWNDLLIWREQPTDDAILDEIIHRWPGKGKILLATWRFTLERLRKSPLHPTGFGQPTAARGLFTHSDGGGN